MRPQIVVLHKGERVYTLRQIRLLLAIHKLKELQRAIAEELLRERGHA